MKTSTSSPASPPKRQKILAARRRALAADDAATRNKQVQALEQEYDLLLYAEARRWKEAELEKLKAMPDTFFKAKRREEIQRTVFQLESDAWIKVQLADILAQPDHPMTPGRVREVAALIFQTREPSQYARSFAALLNRPSPEVQEAAWSFFRRWDRVRHSKVIERTATVEWMDDGQALCRFEHPQFGLVERGFEVEELPDGIEEGQGFTLEMDLDEKDRPFHYRPRKDRPIIPAPTDKMEALESDMPEDWDDTAKMTAYEADLERQVLARMAAAQRWRQDNGY